MSYNKVCTKREVGLHVSIGGVATPETPSLDPGLHSTPLEIGIFFAPHRKVRGAMKLKLASLHSS